MKIYYASRMGKVEKLAKTICNEAIKIESEDLKVNEDFVLFTYTDGQGIVPPVVEKFLVHNHQHLKGVVEAIKIESEDLKVNEDFVLFTYTDGQGIVPPVVEKFLVHNHQHLKGVVVSGSMARHADTYCFAGDIIAKEYNVPCLYKVDGEGTQEDVEAIKALLK